MKSTTTISGSFFYWRNFTLIPAIFTMLLTGFILINDTSAQSKDVLPIENILRKGSKSNVTPEQNSIIRETDAPTIIINVPGDQPTIQAAINAASNGDVISVAPGIYRENITLNKFLSIRGANYGINPNTGIRGAESIIQPGTSDPDPNSPTAVTFFYIEPGGSGSTIDGFTFDGDNNTLISSVNINGANIDAAEAIGAYEGLSNTLVKNNIIKNLNYAGIDYYNYYNGGASTYDNIVTENLFDNIIPAQFGIGVLIYNNCYTSVTLNVMTRVRIGVQTGNFYNADLGTNHSINNNDIESFRIGIFHNLAYTNATTYIITNNDITTVAGAPNNNGMLISSMQSAVGATITDNNVTGARTGYNLWNCPTSNTITITGGIISGCSIGVCPNNYNESFFDAATSTYAITGITMNNCDTGIWVRDNILNTNNATVTLNINNTTNVISGTGIGLLIEGGDASAGFSGAAPVDFSNTLNKYIRLATNGTNVPAANINAESVLFGGTNGAGLSDALLFAVEDKIDHKIDWNALGFVSVKADNNYVTVNSFYPPNTSAASIQNGIDIASAGDTVNLGTGTFNENVILNKALTLKGSGPLSTILTPTVACTGDGINITSSNANVRDLKVTNYNFGLRTSASTISIYNVESVLNCQYAINTGNGTNGLNIVKCKFNDNTVGGWRAGTAEMFSNILIDSCEVKGNGVGVNNGFGIFIAATTSGTNTADNITIKNSDFSNNLKKGMYFEKLRYALIENVYMNNSGNDPAYGFNNGIDFNLKYDTYTDITIRNCVITNCGAMGTAGNIDNPCAVTVKARDDAPSYNSDPATLTLVNIQNNFISGPVNGLRFGEFDKVNNSPTGNTVTENQFGNGYSNKAVINKTANNIGISCNWYGTIISSAVAALHSGSLSYTPFLTNGTDNDLAMAGFQIVPGSCNGPFTKFYVNDNSTTGDVYTTAVGNNANIGTPSDPLLTITYAMSVAAIGDTIYVDVGGYAENVVVTKQFVFLGAKTGVDARGRVVGSPSITVESVLNPASGACFELQAGSSSAVIDGFAMLGNVTGTNGVIQTLTAILSNVQLRNNFLQVTSTNGQGLWFNRGITDVTIDKNEFIGGTASTQIIFLNGPQSFAGMYLTNNNILGSGGTYGMFVDGNRNVGTSATPRSPLFQGNLFQGLVAGMNAGSRSLQDVQFLENTFNNNSQLGFQGGPKNCNFARNTFTGNGLYGMAFTAFGSSDPLRGAQGTTVQNNFFSGNATLPGAFGDILLSNQTAGTQNSNTITENSLLSAIAIYDNDPDGATDTIHASCNWFGAISEFGVSSKIFKVAGGVVISSPWLTNGTDNDLVTAGFQPVPGSCNGLPLTALYVNDNITTGDHYTTAVGNDANAGTSASPFATINFALNNATTGDTIWVDAGTYIEDVVINKNNISIRGSNYLINPNTGSRVAESIVMPVTDDPELGVMITLQQSNLVLDGFLFNGDNPALNSGYAVGSADVNTSEGICNGPALGPYNQIDHINIQNNIFNNFDYQAIYLEVAFNSNHSWNYIKNNKFDNMWEGVQTYALHTDISFNTFTGVDRALSMHAVHAATDPGFVPQIANNTVSITWKTAYSRNIGIWVNYRDGDAPALEVKDNTINCSDASLIGKNFFGFYALTLRDDRIVTFSDNTITGAGNCSRGFYMTNCPSSNITLTGGAFNNIRDYGILMVNNDPTWGAGDVRLTVTNLPITMSPGASAGVLDSTDNSFASNLLGEELLRTRLNRKEPELSGLKTSSSSTYLSDLDISNSTITGGASGIRVSGTLASANIHDNPSTITGAVTGVEVDGGTAALYRNNITANGTGVRVKNSGNLDSATENYITSNTTEGINIEATAGTIGIVSYNDLSGNTGYAINYLKTTPALGAVCNWYGATDAYTVASKINGNVNYITWLTNGADNSPGTAGFQAVPGSCSGVPSKWYVNDNVTTGDVYTTAVGNDGNPGTSASPFATVAHAISQTSAGDTIFVDAGTYPQTSTLSVTYQLTIFGANAGISPTASGTRVAESIIDFTGFSATGTLISISSSNKVQWDGLQFKDDFPVTSAGNRSIMTVFTHGDHMISNNIISRSALSEPLPGSSVSTRGIEIASIPSGETFTISSNKFLGNSGFVFTNRNFRTGIYYNGGLGTVNVTGNNFEFCRTAMNVDDITSGLNITGNTFASNGTSISLGGSVAPTGSYTFGANDFSGLGTIINCSNVAPGFYLDLTSSSYSTIPFSLLTLEQLFGIEAIMVHGTNTARNGLVRVRPNHVFVLPTTAPASLPKGGLQRGVNIALSTDTVDVDSGNYVEQIEINKDLVVIGQGTAGTNVVAPATLPLFFITSANNYPVIYAHDAANIVVKNLTVDGAGMGNSNNRLVGVGYYQAGGYIEDLEIKAVRHTPINGVQGGVGIFGYANAGTARTINANNNNIYDFQKNGITMAGAVLTATVDSNTVTGAGSVSFIAQNGVQLSSGATGSITNNTISGFSYTPASAVSCGVLLFDADGSVITSGNIVNDAQVGIFYYLSSGSISKNTVSYNAANMGATPYWYGIDAESGTTTVNQNTVNGGGNGAGIEADAVTGLDANRSKSDKVMGLDAERNKSASMGEVTIMTAVNNFVDSTDEGFVIYSAGSGVVNCDINENSITKSTTNSIHNYGTDSVDATCNWYGVINSVAIGSKITGLVDYVPFLTNGTDDSLAAAGFQPVPGSCNGLPETKLYVNDNSLSGDVFTSSAGSDSNNGTPSDPFLTISHAVSIANASDTIYVDAGTYQEQVNIDKSLTITGADSAGSSAAVVKAPLVMNTVTNANGSGFTSVIYAFGSSLNVNISHIAVDGDGRGGAKFSGVYYFEASGSFTNSKIMKVRDATYSGVQSGNAFFANHTYDVSLNQTVTVSDNVIEDYQKTGILINELNTQGIVTNNIVTGQSIQHVNGQNGIQFGYGAYGTITGNTVTGNQYNGPASDAASGILLAGVGVDASNVPTGNITTIGGPGSLANIMNGNEVGLLTDGGGFGYDSNAGVIYNANNFAVNYIHVSESAPNTVPSLLNTYDKRIDNTSQTNVVYGQIQRSVDDASAGNILNVSAHTFTEQVEIHKALTLAGQGIGMTTILSPNTLTKFFTTGSNNNRPIIYVHDTSGVIIKNLTVDGAGKGNANYRFIGIGYRNAGGTVRDCEIKAIRETPMNGNQHGVGVYALDDNGIARTLNVLHNTIYDFQKNGTALSGVNLTAIVDSNTVTGSGPINFTAQNGIQVSFGAKGSIKNNKISSINYSPLTAASCGILVYQTTDTVVVSSDSIKDCQTALYMQDAIGNVTNNIISMNNVNMGTTPNWWGIVSENGTFKMTGNTINGGDTTKAEGVNPYSGNGETTNITFTNNFVSNCLDGIIIQNDGTGTVNGEWHENSITNSATSINNTTTVLQNAKILNLPNTEMQINNVRAVAKKSIINSSKGDANGKINGPMAATVQNATCNWYGTTNGGVITSKISGAITFAPYLTSGIDFNPAPGFQPIPGSCNGLPASTLNIKVLQEGFYNPGTQLLNMKDTVRAYLHLNFSPYTVLDSAISTVDSITFTGSFQFTQPNGTYYIVIRHRNTIETWSKSGGEAFTSGSTMNYDFTDLITKAFSSNMKQVDTSPLTFGIYSGDVNQDGLVEATDLSMVDNESANFSTGYIPEDVTGDGIVDGSDGLITGNNAANFVSSVTP